MNLFFYLLINSLVIIGVQEAIKTKHFRPFFSWLRERVPSVIWSPTFGCHKCMSSVYGTLFYFLVMKENLSFEFPFYILALCGMVSLLNQIKN